MTLMLAPKTSTDWDATIDAPWVYRQFPHSEDTLSLSENRRNKTLLHDHWPASKCRVKAREVLSMAGKLWTLAYAVRAGRYFL